MQFLSWFSELLPVLVHYSIGFVALAAFIVVGWFFPAARQIAFFGAIAIGLIIVAYGNGVENGQALVQARWDAAVQQTQALADEARSDAEASIPAVVPEPPPVRGSVKPAGVHHAVRPKCKPLDRYDLC